MSLAIAYVISVVLAVIAYGLAKGFLIEYHRRKSGSYTTFDELGCWLYAILVPGLLAIFFALAVSLICHREINFRLIVQD